MWAFASREIRVRYSNTSFGLLWVLLQPIPSVLVFTFFFDKIIEVDTGDVPYSVFALIGLVGWNYFTYLSISMGNALHESADVVKKIDFPRILLPLSRVVSGGVDFLFALVLIAVAMLLFRTWPDSSLLFFPFYVMLNIISGAALGIWFCILTYRRKDLMHVFPVLVNFGIWLSPVFFPTTILPPELEKYMYLNPMTVVCEGYRFALVGGEAPGLSHYVSVPFVILLLASGIVYFRRIDRRIPEHT
jgi:lipopolysaccharide transport system permease protein